MSNFIETYNHNHEIAVMVEFQAEDDFTFRTDEFLLLATDIALHIAASDPEKEAHGSSILSLLNQRFVKDESKSVREVLEESELKLKSKVRVIRYIRYSTDEHLAY